MESNLEKIAVIGSGIIGLTTAYYLAKNNYAVSVFEEQRYSAMKTSFANGGQISVSNSEVWNTYSNVTKGIKWAFKKDAPLYIPLTFDWAKIKWLAKFMYHTVKNEHDANTILTIAMGLKSRDLYKQIVHDECMQFEFNNCGILHFYKTPSYANQARIMGQLYRKNGCDWTDLNDNSSVLSMENNLSNHGDIIYGGFTESDFVGDIFEFCQELENILKTKYNVKFNYDRKITDLNDLTEYDKVVVSAGVGSAKLAKSVGDCLDIYPVKGYSITIHNNDVNNLPKLSLLDDEAKIVTSTIGNKLRIAGTAELNGENYDIVRSRIDPLLNWVKVNLPQVDCREYTQFACLRPMTPNLLPIVKRSSKNNRIYYNTGHGHLGWTLAPCTATQLLDLFD